VWQLGGQGAPCRESDLRLVSIFAHNAAIAIENSRPDSWVQLRMPQLIKWVKMVLAETSARSPA
jgi:hypothetical protein